jgi:hypothetical protein
MSRLWRVLENADSGSRRPKFGQVFTAASRIVLHQICIRFASFASFASCVCEFLQAVRPANNCIRIASNASQRATTLPSPGSDRSRLARICAIGRTQNSTKPSFINKHPAVPVRGRFDSVPNRTASRPLHLHICIVTDNRSSARPMHDAVEKLVGDAVAADLLTAGTGCGTLSVDEVANCLAIAPSAAPELASV